MTKILIYIKHRLPFFWLWIEWSNHFLFNFFYYKKFLKGVNEIIKEHQLPDFNFSILNINHLNKLETLLNKQLKERIQFFNPHRFDYRSIHKMYKNHSFIMMGVFNTNEELVGYFFLRCFWNKKCFVGRLIDKEYEGIGIGRVMNQIMYNIAWQSGFKCLSTISRNNQMVMKSHAKNKTMRILKELPNNYLLVEFVRLQNL